MSFLLQSFTGHTPIFSIFVGFPLENPQALILQTTFQDFRGGKGSLRLFNVEVFNTKLIDDIKPALFTTIDGMPYWYTKRVGFKFSSNQKIYGVYSQPVNEPAPTVVNVVCSREH